MEAAVAKYDAELAAMGINLQDLTTAAGGGSGASASSGTGSVNSAIDSSNSTTGGGKAFIYNEVALGGGLSECGNVTATDPAQVGYGLSQRFKLVFGRVLQ